MELILKVSTINTVRDSVLGHPIFITIILIMAALRSDFGYFGDLPKIHLDPLPFVIPLGSIEGAMVEPSFAWSSSTARARLPEITNCTSFHKSIYCSLCFFSRSYKYKPFFCPQFIRITEWYVFLLFCSSISRYLARSLQCGV